MFNESNQRHCEYERDLDAWTCACYDAAVARDFIRSSYHPDAATVNAFKATSTPGCCLRKPLKHASGENNEKALPYRIVVRARPTLRKTNNELNSVLNFQLMKPGKK